MSMSMRMMIRMMAPLSYILCCLWPLIFFLMELEIRIQNEQIFLMFLCFLDGLLHITKLIHGQIKKLGMVCQNCSKNPLWLSKYLPEDSWICFHTKLLWQVYLFSVFKMSAIFCSTVHIIVHSQHVGHFSHTNRSFVLPRLYSWIMPKISQKEGERHEIHISLCEHFPVAVLTLYRCIGHAHGWSCLMYCAVCSTIIWSRYLWVHVSV